MSHTSHCNAVDSSVAKAFDEFADSHAGPYGIDDIADWILAAGRWQPERRVVKKELKKLLTKVAKSRRYRDPQGRLVRTMHAAKYPRGVDKNGQMIFETMWDYHLTMSAAHAQMSFSQRWDQIAGACKSLKRDTDSFNDNNLNSQGQQIQLAFDFEAVVDCPEDQRVEYVDVLDTEILREPKPR